MSDRTEICTTTTTVSEGVRTRYGGNADSSDTDSTDIAMKNSGGSKGRRTASPASSTGDEEGGERRSSRRLAPGKCYSCVLSLLKKYSPFTSAVASHLAMQGVTYSLPSFLGLTTLKHWLLRGKNLTSITPESILGGGILEKILKKFVKFWQSAQMKYGSPHTGANTKTVK